MAPRDSSDLPRSPIASISLATTNHPCPSQPSLPPQAWTWTPITEHLPCAMWNTWYTLPIEYIDCSDEGDTVMISILQAKILRISNPKDLGQGHMVSKWERLLFWALPVLLCLHERLFKAWLGIGPRKRRLIQDPLADTYSLYSLISSRAVLRVGLNHYHKWGRAIVQAQASACKLTMNEQNWTKQPVSGPKAQ